MKARGDRELHPVDPDPDAVYAHVREIDLSRLVPYVAKPHFIPGNCVPVAEVEGLPVNQVVLGSCSNGRIEDLQIAAGMVKGRHVAPGVRFIVTPPLSAIYLQAVQAGVGGDPGRGRRGGYQRHLRLLLRRTYGTHRPW